MVYLIYNPKSKRVKRVDQIRVTLSLKGINDLHDKPSFYRLDDSIKELSEDIVHNKLDLYRSDRDAEESSEDIEAKDHREVRSRFFSNTALAPSDSSLGTHFAIIALTRKKRKPTKVESDPEDASNKRTNS
jgi:hypothetical protein